MNQQSYRKEMAELMEAEVISTSALIKEWEELRRHAATVFATRYVAKVRFARLRVTRIRSFNEGAQGKGIRARRRLERAQLEDSLG